MKWTRLNRVWTPLMLAALILSLGACGGKKKPPPEILNINSSTDPSSPVGLAIEINGSGFRATPGEVIFTEIATSTQMAVAPSAAGWTDTGIVVVVPAGDGATNFAVPGTVAVTVRTSKAKRGESNAIDLDLVETLTFDVNNVTWTTTTALPVPLAGHRAAAVPGADSTTAFAVVTGGYDGAGNVSTVLSNSLTDTGQVSGDWTAITAASLTAARAHHGMVVAHPGNSLIAINSRFIYVIGGQETATDTPGGVATVLRGSVSPTTGEVSNWTQLNNSLPEALVGPAVSLFNGFIYVVGGLGANGMPSAQVYSAEVMADGSISTWTTSPNPYPVGISFATAFGFGGRLYVVGGDEADSTDPNEQRLLGVSMVRMATARKGEVGAWTDTAGTVKQRKKHVTWIAFGQVIQSQGIYNGLPGSTELERSTVQSDGTLASWNAITANVNQIGANVYNAGALVSPLQSPSGKPRFLLIGGQAFTQTPPGALDDKVYYNDAP